MPTYNEDLKTLESTDKLAYIKRRHDRAYSATEDIRERAANDLLFARYTQWDDTLDATFAEYRGEFNILRPARRRIVSAMRENDINISYHPDDGADPDSADTMNGYYRTSVRENVSKSSIDVAVGDQIDCGYGAWRLITEYASESNNLDNTQVIKRVPIHEANNVVYWDPDSQFMDKSDAKFCTILTPYTKDGFEEMLDDLGISEDRRKAIETSSFAEPEESYVYPWSYGNSVTFMHVGEHYEIKESKEKIKIYLLPDGELTHYTEEQLEKMDQPPEDTGAIYRGEKVRKRKKVYKYVLTGGSIIDGPTLVPGQCIPIVPLYGEWFFVEGVESWEGITRLAKDPSRLRNMMFSYLADIMGKGARRKPFFFPEQVAGFQQMYDQDNNYPYYLLQSKDAEGNLLPQGPIQYMENQQIPPALDAMINLTTDSVNQLTPQGVDGTQLRTNVAFDTVDQVNRNAEEQMYVYLDNLASAQRRDAEIFASMSQDIIDTTREVMLTDEAGVQSSATFNDAVMDLTTLNEVVLNDIRRGRFVPVATIGRAYSTQKDETREDLKEVMMSDIVDPNIRQIATLQFFTLSDGSSMQILRDYADMQLVLMGVKEPSTDEQREALQAQQEAQAQQGQNDPAAMIGQAELITAQSDAAETEANILLKEEQAAKARADAFKTLIEADNARREVSLKEIDTQVSAAERLAAALRPDSQRVLN
jgi:hypothetical protein